MAKRKKKEETPPVEEIPQEELLAKLDLLEKVLAKNEDIRKKQALITRIGLVLIALAIAIFIYSLYSFVKNYDTQAFAKELEKGSQVVLESHEVRTLMDKLQNHSLPILQKELSKKFQANRDKLEEKGLQAAKNLQKHLDGEVKDRVLNDLTGSIQDIEQDLLKAYPDISPEEMDEVVKEAQAHFINEITNSVEKKLDVVSNDLQSLNNSFELLKHDPEYEKLDPKMTSEISGHLVEAMLELCIYNINPKRGAERAFPEGGAK